jgi:membrane fusion protein, multidrug efflux system
MNQMERIETEIKRQTSHRSGWRRRVISTIVIVAIAAGVAVVLTQTPTQRAALTSRFQRQTNQPVPTLATAARITDVPVYLEGVGTTKALNTVTVSAQVDGKLLNIYFTEGQDVDRGFVLAQIDPTIYQAQYDQAVAKKAQDEATLANARIDLDRYIRLAATNAGPKQQADTQKALVAQLEAQVKADQASIENQRAYLNYTKVVAPITGRTGMRLVDAGNIVQGSSGTPMVMITQLRPISIIFTLPQQKLGQVTKALAAGPVMVEAFGPDNKTVIDTGKLVVVDNQIDQTTGTIRLKGEFPNAELQLWPGQFCDVRILVDTLRNVVVVPNAAVQRGPNGPFVFVVDNDSKVTMRRVTVTQQDETQAVIASGVQNGDRVVTTSFNQLSEGKAVTIKGDTSSPAKPDAPEERPTRQRGKDSEGSLQSDRPRSPNTQRRTEREGTSQTP